MAKTMTADRSSGASAMSRGRCNGLLLLLPVLLLVLDLSCRGGAVAAALEGPSTLADRHSRPGTLEAAADSRSSSRRLRKQRLRRQQQQQQQQQQQPAPRWAPQLLTRYLSNEELLQHMQGYVARCAAISRLFSIGKSVEGNDLWALEISDRPGVLEPEPYFKIIGNIHGNEPTGRQLLLALAEWLCDSHERHPQARQLVRDTHLFLLPSINPDGFARRDRSNARGIDLNRNFPDHYHHADRDLRLPLPRTQPETRALMDFTLRYPFVGSLALHEGAVVANYPWDGYASGSTQLQGLENQTPDDDDFRHFASLYAQKHAFMSQSREFRGGVTNGARWYPVYGSMQDWNYAAAGVMELTVEVDDVQWPKPEARLLPLWQENRAALVALPLAMGLGGVCGSVTLTGGAETAGALALRTAGHLHARHPAAGVWITGHGMSNVSVALATGHYCRPLAPGTYTLNAAAPGYAPVSATVVVPPDGKGVRRDFVLQPAGSSGGVSGSRTTAAAAVSPGGSTWQPQHSRPIRLDSGRNSMQRLQHVQVQQDRAESLPLHVTQRNSDAGGLLAAARIAGLVVAHVAIVAALAGPMRRLVDLRSVAASGDRSV